MKNSPLQRSRWRIPILHLEKNSHPYPSVVNVKWYFMFEICCLTGYHWHWNKSPQLLFYTLQIKIISMHNFFIIHYYSCRELKTKIMKEDTKRELLEYQPKLSDSLCIRCLQPFKFLVNSKRQCLDCKLFVCKSCSHFNKKDRGWVCDPCHMARWAPDRHVSGIYIYMTHVKGTT